MVVTVGIADASNDQDDDLLNFSFTSHAHARRRATSTHLSPFVYVQALASPLLFLFAGRCLPVLPTAMSFLSRRKTNGTNPSHTSLLQDSANVPRKSTAATASIYSVESKKAPSILRKKHISFPSSFNKLAAKLTSRHPPAASTHAPVGNVGSPLAPWRSRSPSPALSLDIRMPAGLGRRASELGDREEFEEYEVHEGAQRLQPRPERKRSISLPAVGLGPRGRAADLHAALLVDRPQHELKKPALARVSPELLSSVFSYGTYADLFSLSQVSKSWSQAALRALYDDIDLRNMDDERVEQCVASLASHRSLAALVRKFACRDLPPLDGIAVGMATSLSVVTFAIALTNMEHLHTLTLPHFDLRVLAHTTFSLRSLTLHSKNIYGDEFHALFSWLGRHPALHTLSFPNLVLPSLPPVPSKPIDTRKIPSRPHTPHTPDTPPQASRRPATSHDCKSKSSSPSPTAESPTPPLFPTTLLPQLHTLTCPPVLATALVPGRPLVRVQIPIQCTLYDGLRPSALMSALAAARETLRVLAIQPASTKIDQRTIERVVMAAGAELGECVETLEVHWVLDDEVRCCSLLARDRGVFVFFVGILIFEFGVGLSCRSFCVLDGYLRAFLWRTSRFVLHSSRHSLTSQRCAFASAFYLCIFLCRD